MESNSDSTIEIINITISLLNEKANMLLERMKNLQIQADKIINDVRSYQNE